MALRPAVLWESRLLLLPRPVAVVGEVRWGAAGGDVWAAAVAMVRRLARSMQLGGEGAEAPGPGPTGTGGHAFPAAFTVLRHFPNLPLCSYTSFAYPPWSVAAQGHLETATSPKDAQHPVRGLAVRRHTSVLPFDRLSSHPQHALDSSVRYATTDFKLALFLQQLRHYVHPSGADAGRIESVVRRFQAAMSRIQAIADSDDVARKGVGRHVQPGACLEILRLLQIAGSTHGLVRCLDVTRARYQRVDRTQPFSPVHLTLAMTCISRSIRHQRGRPADEAARKEFEGAAREAVSLAADVVRWAVKFKVELNDLILRKHLLVLAHVSGSGGLSLAEEAVRVISVYEAHGSPLTERSLAAALDLLLKVGLPLGEAEAFALAHEKRGIVSSEAWAVIAAGAMCRRDYNSSAVEKYAETGGSRDALIRTCLRTLLTTGGSVDLEALRLILPELPKRLLTGPDESPDPRTPVEVIGEIRAHTLAGDADYALALAEQLANEQGFVDQRKAAFGLEATLNTLLVGLYVRKARWPHALGIFEAAARQGTTPEPRTLYELCNAPGTWGPQAAPAIVEFWETCLKHNFHWVVSGCNGQPAKRDKVLARVAAALRAEHAFAETAEFERIVRASGLPVPGKPQGPNGRFSKAARRTPPGGRAPSLDAFVARGDWEAVGGLLDALAAAAGSGGWTLFEEPVLQALALLRAAKREPAARQLYRRALGARGLPPALRAAFAAAYGPVFAPGPLPPPPSRAAGRASASARSGLTAPGEKPREKSDSLLGSRGVQQVQTASVVGGQGQRQGHSLSSSSGGLGPASARPGASAPGEKPREKSDSPLGSRGAAPLVGGKGHSLASSSGGLGPDGFPRVGEPRESNSPSGSGTVRTAPLFGGQGDKVEDSQGSLSSSARELSPDGLPRVGEPQGSGGLRSAERPAQSVPLAGGQGDKVANSWGSPSSSVGSELSPDGLPRVGEPQGSGGLRSAERPAQSVPLAGGQGDKVANSCGSPSSSASSELSPDGLPRVTEPAASGLAKPHERDPAAGPERAAQYPQRKAAPFQAKGHPHRQPRSAASPDPAGFTAAGPVAPAAHAPAARSIAAAGKARRGGAVELPLIELELDEFGSSAAGGRTRSEAGQVPSTARVGTKKLRAPQREPAVEGAALVGSSGLAVERVAVPKFGSNAGCSGGPEVGSATVSEFASNVGCCGGPEVGSVAAPKLGLNVGCSGGLDVGSVAVPKLGLNVGCSDGPEETLGIGEPGARERSDPVLDVHAAFRESAFSQLASFRCIAGGEGGDSRANAGTSWRLPTAT